MIKNLFCLILDKQYVHSLGLCEYQEEHNVLRCLFVGWSDGQKHWSLTLNTHSMHRSYVCVSLPVSACVSLHVSVSMTSSVWHCLSLSLCSCLCLTCLCLCISVWVYMIVSLYACVSLSVSFISLSCRPISVCASAMKPKLSVDMDHGL